MLDIMFEMIRPVLQRVLGREQAAPRRAEEVEVVFVQPEGLADLLDFLDETRQVPQLGIVRLVAVVGPELIVEVVLDPLGRKEAVDCLVVLVRHARPAVQQQDLHARIVADALRPDMERALRRLDRNHPHAAGLHR
jgi:hypothetical protein